MKTNLKQKLLIGLDIIVKYLKPHKKAVLTLGILSIASALTNVSVPYLGGKIIDRIYSNQTFSFLYFDYLPLVLIVIAAWFILKLISDLVDWQLEVRNYKLSSEIEGQYLVKGYGRLLDLPLSFHKKHKMGEMGNRISRAADQLAIIVEALVIDLAPRCLSIILALIFAILIQPILAMVLVLSALIYVLMLVKIAPRMAKMSSKLHRSFSNAYGDAFDSVLNVASVKQATAENYEKRKLRRNFISRAFRFWIELVKLRGRLSIWQRVLIDLVQLTIFVASVFLIRNGKLTIGELVALNAYAAMFFSPFVTLGRNWQSVQNGIIAIQRSEKILNLPTEKYDSPDHISVKDISGEVEFKNVSFTYGKKQNTILKDISFRVPAGTKVALVGESGVGKSTLIDLISYYFKPTAGKILIDGHPIEKFNLKFLRSRIAVVPQEIILFNDTIRNNITYGSFGKSDDEIIEAAKRADAYQFIASFPKQLNQIVGERGIKLSAGQKQRIAIARAILKNPKILILDEPTSALDAKSEEYLKKSIRELTKNRTTFIIAHRFSTVREADIILVLDKGTIVESGTHEELLAKDGVYRKLYDLQVGLS
jgi:ABC-type multidrug transport system fused ATPase/permease subunit